MEFTKSTFLTDFVFEAESATIRSTDILDFVFVEQKKLSSVKAYVDSSDFNQNYDNLKKRGSNSSNQLRNDVVPVDMTQNGSSVLSG